jgi:hypothetical protein
MEAKMDNTNTLNHNIAVIGWSMLLIWWGIAILVKPVTIGMTAIGTGLILLGLNVFRWRKGLPTRGSNTIIGIIALVWGALDHTFALSFWLSFATLLIVIGVVALASLLVRPQTVAEGESAP